MCCNAFVIVNVTPKGMFMRLYTVNGPEINFDDVRKAPVHLSVNSKPLWRDLKL